LNAASNPVSTPQSTIVSNTTAPADRIRNGLTNQMLALLDKADGKSINLGTVVSAVSSRGHAMLIILLSFPLCLPVGIPILSSTLGLALGLVGLLGGIGCEIRVPKSIAAKEITYSRLSYVIERLLRISAWIDRWFRPRIPFLATNSAMIRIHGFFVMFLGVLAAVPLPLPFNNMVAALPILLLGISLLEKDGLLAVVSYLAAIPVLIYYGALVYLGYAGFERLMGFWRS
jgi:hypothetical protein